MNSEQTERSNVKPARSNRRRKHLINPRFQWKYLSMAVLGVFVVSSFVTVAIFGVLYQQARSAALATSEPGSIATVMVLCALASALAPALGFGFWTIFVTHRICGPIAVMKSYLAQLMTGRLPATRPLRPKDEFQDFHSDLCRALNQMRTRTESHLASLNEIEQTARRASCSSADDREEALASISQRAHALAGEHAALLGRDIAPLGYWNDDTKPPLGSEKNELVAGAA